MAERSSTGRRAGGFLVAGAMALLKVAQDQAISRPAIAEARPVPALGQTLCFVDKDQTCVTAGPRPKRKPDRLESDGQRRFPW